MHRNTCLEALLEHGTVPSEEHEVPLDFGVITAYYKGQWKDNWPHGKGTMKWPGVVDECEWRNGKKHGFCKTTFADGHVGEIYYHEGVPLTDDPDDARRCGFT